jgi:hypothetical protein
VEHRRDAGRNLHAARHRPWTRIVEPQIVRRVRCPDPVPGDRWNAW